MSTRREELVATATRLFAERGYHGTSMADLAEALGVQKGSLYSHIASKEDLLYDALMEGGAAFHASLDAIPEEAPPVEGSGVTGSRCRRHSVSLVRSSVSPAEWRDRVEAK